MSDALLSKVYDNWNRPSWWVGKVIPYIKMKIMVRYFAMVNNDGCDIMSEDWDNLVILDGCRYDLFQDVNIISGKLERKTSKGSATHEFLRENFENKVLRDTVYVTANPMYVVVDLQDVFYDTVDVWKTNWNDEYKTVLPNDMAKATKEAHDRYPDKRIISHFVQPHHPFIGEIGQRIENQAGIEKLKKEAITGDGESDSPDVWMLLKSRKVSKEEVWKAYRENLVLVLKHVEQIMESLNGKTVITSDHGNLVGEFATPFPIREYGHPAGIHTRKLVEVPWLIIDPGCRKVINPGKNVRSQSTVEESARGALRDLGYVM